MRVRCARRWPPRWHRSPSVTCHRPWRTRRVVCFLPHSCRSRGGVRAQTYIARYGRQATAGCAVLVARCRPRCGGRATGTTFALDVPEGLTSRSLLHGLCDAPMIERTRAPGCSRRVPMTLATMRRLRISQPRTPICGYRPGTSALLRCHLVDRVVKPCIASSKT